MTIREIPVIPPKIKKGKEIEDNIAEWLPNKKYGGFSLLLVGKRMSGKSVLLTYCLLCPNDPDGGWAKNFKEILIFSPSIHTDASWTAIKNLDNVLVSESVSGQQLETILEKQKSLYKKSRNNTLLIILDDISSTIKNKKSGICPSLDKYWSTARQFGTSIAMCAQNLSHASTTIRANCSNIFCFRVSDRESKMLASENSSRLLTEKGFCDMLFECTKDPYSFFNIDWAAPDPYLIYGAGFRVME